MEELKDIKGFVAVPDDSFFHLMLIVGGVVVLLLLIALFWWWNQKPKRRRRRLSPQAIAREQLQLLDFEDTKGAVYGFSEHAQLLAPDDPKLQELLKKLEIYKYKKEVPTLSQEDKAAMQRIIKELSDAK